MQRIRWRRQIRAIRRLGLDSDTDLELLRNRSEVELAWLELMRRYEPQLRNYMILRVGRADAARLTGEVFALAYRGDRPLRADRGSIRPWLFGIATEVLYGAGAQAFSVAAPPSSDNPLAPANYEPPYDVPVAERRALDAVDDSNYYEREIVHLAFDAGLRNKEVALVLNIHERRVERTVERVSQYLDP